MKKKPHTLWSKPQGRVTRISGDGTGARPESPKSVALPALQTAGSQWTRIATILGGAMSSASLALQLQRSAGEQLDAASYALDHLRQELSGTMRIEPMKGIPVAGIVRLQQPFRSHRYSQALGYGKALAA